MKIPGTKTLGNTKASNTVRVTKRGRVAIPANMRRDRGLEAKKYYLLHFNEDTNTLYATFYENEDDAPEPPLSFTEKRLEITPVFNRLGLSISEGTVELEWDSKYKAVKINLKVLLL